MTIAEVSLDPAPAPSRGGGVRAGLWRAVGQRAFRATFHNWYGVRRAILRAFGARIDGAARLRSTVRIALPWNLTIGAESAVGDHAVLLCHSPVTIGRFCTVSQYAIVASGGYIPGDRAFEIRTAPVVLEDDAWVAADAYVGPGVTLGPGGIVGSRASVFHDVPAKTIVTGSAGEHRSARKDAAPGRLLHSCPNPRGGHGAAPGGAPA